MDDTERNRLVSAAAEAVEIFGEDELERFAAADRREPQDRVALHKCLLCGGGGIACKGTPFERKCPPCGGEGWVSAEVYFDQCGEANELARDLCS